MSEPELNAESKAHHAVQVLLEMAWMISSEFGWTDECQEAYDSAEWLYTEYGPFEIEIPYGRDAPRWYDE